MMVWRVVYFGFLLHLAVFCIGLITLLCKRSVMCMSWHTWFFPSVLFSHPTPPPHHTTAWVTPTPYLSQILRGTKSTTISLSRFGYFHDEHTYISGKMMMIRMMDDLLRQVYTRPTEERGRLSGMMVSGWWMMWRNFLMKKKLHRAKRACILSKCSLLWCLHVQCTVSFMNKWNKNV